MGLLLSNKSQQTEPENFTHPNIKNLEKRQKVLPHFQQLHFSSFTAYRMPTFTVQCLAVPHTTLGACCHCNAALAWFPGCSPTWPLDHVLTRKNFVQALYTVMYGKIPHLWEFLPASVTWWRFIPSSSILTLVLLLSNASGLEWSASNEL